MGDCEFYFRFLITASECGSLGRTNLPTEDGANFQGDAPPGYSAFCPKPVERRAEG